MRKYLWGRAASGENIYLFTLENSAGAHVSITNFGGAVTSLCVPDKNGLMRDVVLGFDRLEDYEAQDKLIGATIGRHANRIARGQFSLGGRNYQLACNDGKNHMHGGKIGFDKRVWEFSEAEDALLLRYFSANGEEGYPGNLHVAVAFSFSDSNELTIDYTAESDADTVVNLTNHSYFNLSGGGSGSILDTKMQLFCDFFTENDAESLPTGVILPVQGSPFDFTREKALGRDIAENLEQLVFGNGYDHNFVIRGALDGGSDVLRPAASALSPESGIRMDCLTTMPGVQLYTGNYLDGVRGKGGAIYGCREGFCLETQYFPNAMKCVDFPSPILEKGQGYHHRTVYQFGTVRV